MESKEFPQSWLSFLPEQQQQLKIQHEEEDDTLGSPLACVVEQRLRYCNLAPHTFVIAIQLFPSDCTIVHCFAFAVCK